MYEEENMTPSEKALESALGQLKPMANILNRDQLMFKAGRASVRSKGSWQIFSGVLSIMLLVSISINFSLFNTGNTSQEDKIHNIQIAQTEFQPAKIESSNFMAYPKLRESVIKFGPEAMEKQQRTKISEPARNQKQWLDSMLSS